jgi:2-amino-4-hydroxy-6-hydroxymethyldihydropteridine diphosphokinase
MPQMPWWPVYVGIGSNLEHPVLQIQRACTALAGLPATSVVRVSPLYGSVPFGPVQQPNYVNAVAALLTQLDLQSFFKAMRTLEGELGRLPPRVRWGARIIDLDLLAYAQQSVQTNDLTVPHPGIVQRNWVLYPLRDVAPELTVPGCGRAAELADRIGGDGIWRLEDEATTHDA